MAEEIKAVETGAPKAAVEVKPLSQNAFAAFFQKIWRWWLGVWYGFENKHPKLSKFILQFVVFWLISNLVTIFQYLIFLFLPNMFGLELAGTDWYLFSVELPWMINGEHPVWHLFGYGILYETNKAGEFILNAAGQKIVKIGGGLGYTLAFAIGTFLAQCINFPMQRNLTYHSHGNPWLQGLGYFVFWIFINLFSTGVNNIWHAWGEVYVAPALYKLLDTFIMGTISLWLSFLFFKFIFPDAPAQCKSEEAKLAKMKESGAPAEKIAEFEAKHAKTVKMAEVTVAEKDFIKAQKLYDSKALAWDSMCQRAKAEKTKLAAKVEKGESAEEQQKSQESIAKFEQFIAEKYQEALEALAAKEKAEADFNEVLKKYGIASAKEAFAKEAA